MIEKYTIELTESELDFLLWAIGYLVGMSSDSEESYRRYIHKNHDTILPKLIEAKKNE